MKLVPSPRPEEVAALVREAEAAVDLTATAIVTGPAAAALVAAEAEIPRAADSRPKIIAIVPDSRANRAGSPHVA